MHPRPLINLIESVPSSSIAYDNSDLDFFEDSLSSLFCDARNQHGDPGEVVVYKAQEYFGKDIVLKLVDPEKGNTRLFAHFLWNAGVQAAEMIACDEFKVKGETVLEFGAGAALPSIVSMLSGAKEVVISDYPTAEIQANISTNVARNVSPDQFQAAKVAVCGHMWGNFPTTDDRPNPKHPLLSVLKEPHSFTRIIVADCMWMEYEHENLCSSIVHYLDPIQGEMLAIAGFHTGREKVANFFKTCKSSGLVLQDELIELNVDGETRPWAEDRGREDVIERKRWVVIGRFKKADHP
ncbi:hypothetical protein DFH27DRAFT_568856 [Peziza echinospora]|nr:hypothetical protein DFH27DRAFT_568856 [Peziza echinospora]